MKNTTFFKYFIGFGAFLAVFSVISPVSAAYYYDQQGQPIYYDTYTVPGGQFYPAGPTVSYGYPTGNYGYAYNPAYGYNTIYGYGYTGSGYTSNRQPVIWSSPVRDAIDGQTYVAGINASDPDNNQIQYQLVSGPEGMTIDPVTGLLRWTNTSGKKGQTFPVTVGVTDGRSPLVTQSYVITVRTYGGGGSTATTANSGTSGSTSGTTTKTGTASIFDIFGGKKTAATAIVIKDVNVISGPKNINDTSDRNCEVYVTWNTNVVTAGQVLYGTQSQQSIANYAYPETAAEGNSFVKQHSVKLGCLANTTYFFRVVAFSATDRAVSSEYTIFPVTIRTQIPEAVRDAGASVLAATTSNNSIVGQLGRLFAQPILWIVVLVAVVWYALLQILRRANLKSQRIKEKQAKEAMHASAHSSADAHGGHGAPSMEIPMLAVPHH